LLLRRPPDLSPATLSRAASEVSSDGVIGLDARDDSVNRQCLLMWNKAPGPVIKVGTITIAVAAEDASA